MPLPFLPAPGQGALGIRAKENNREILAMLGKINDPDSLVRAQAERAFLKTIDSGCHIPVGLRSEVNGRTLHLEAAEFSESGERVCSSTKEADITQAADSGAGIAYELLQARANS